MVLPQLETVLNSSSMLNYGTILLIKQSVNLEMMLTLSWLVIWRQLYVTIILW